MKTIDMRQLLSTGVFFALFAALPSLVAGPAFAEPAKVDAAKTVEVAQAQTTKITVRFTWKLKGEYAPLFVALDKGFYADEGLDVELLEGAGSSTVMQLLAAGNEQMGYGPAAAAAKAVSRGMGVQVVALYQANAPMAVISFPDIPLGNPKDMEGRTLALNVGETFVDMLKPFAEMNGVDISRITQVQMSNAARVSQFLSRKVDLMSVYTSNELPTLEKRAGTRFNVMKIADFGLTVLGASFIASSDFAAKNPDAVRALLKATARGYEDAIKDPDGATAIMHKHMKLDFDIDILREQVAATLVSTNVIAGKPIGWQERIPWEANLELIKRIGVIDEIKDIDLYYTNEFLN